MKTFRRSEKNVNMLKDTCTLAGLHLENLRHQNLWAADIRDKETNQSLRTLYGEKFENLYDNVQDYAQAFYLGKQKKQELINEQAKMLESAEAEIKRLGELLAIHQAALEGVAQEKTKRKI